MTTSDELPPRDQPVLSAIAVAAMLLMLPVLLLAGDLRLLTIPGVLLAAALVAGGRDTLHALAALAVVSILWLTSHADTLTPWSVMAAALMLTTHGAVALRSSVPPGAAIEREIGVRWVRRGAGVLALTAVVYLVGVGVHQLRPGTSELVVVIALVLGGVLVLLLRSETVRGSEA